MIFLVQAVTKTGHVDLQVQDDLHKHNPPSRRNRSKKKKLRSPHQLAAYNTSDRKAAVTVGVIMGVFLGETDYWQLCLRRVMKFSCDRQKRKICVESTKIAALRDGKAMVNYNLFEEKCCNL